MLAHYNKRVKELFDSKEELYDFMAKSAPYLLEYSAIESHPLTHHFSGNLNSSFIFFNFVHCS